MLQSNYTHLDKMSIGFITAKGVNEVLQFFIYEEMGFGAPTLYGTMMTQASADKMWGHTKTSYWPLTALGQCVRRLPASEDDTRPSQAV